jgi:predicted RNA methylase
MAARSNFKISYTPPDLAEQMATRARLKPGMRVLEPSVGEGALVKAAHACAPRLMFYCVDNDEPTFMRFSKTWDGFSGASLQGHLADFLQVIPPVKPEQMFDVVLMNPPFTGGADTAHVTHAWRFVKDGGVLVALTSLAWRTAKTKAAIAFREPGQRRVSKLQPPTIAAPLNRALSLRDATGTTGARATGDRRGGRGHPGQDLRARPSRPRSHARGWHRPWSR